MTQIPDEDRMTGEEIDQATVGAKGRERWQLAARIAEERAYAKGFETGGDAREDDPEGEYRQGFDAGVAQAEAESTTDPMVKCPACKGTGKLWGYGDQCKRCFGATVVRASSVEAQEQEVTPDGG